MAKPVYKSKTVWASVGVLTATILGAFNVDVSTQEQSAIIGGVFTLVAVIMRLTTKDAVTILPKTDKLNTPVFAAIAALVLILFLSGCGALGMNKQQYAGLERWEVSGNQTVEGNWQITDVIYTNGKELNTSDIAISLNGGETILNFTGSGIKAFEGQSLRAEVDKVISEKIGDNIPGLTDAIMKLLGK